MVTVPVPTGRASIEEDGLSLRVIIPASRNVFLTLFLTVWLAGWFFGESFALRDLLAPSGDIPRGFLGVWLAGWTVGGLFAGLTLLWRVLGREVLELRPDTLVHRRVILGVGPARAYDLTAVKDFRVGPPVFRVDRLSFSSLFDRQSTRPDYSRIGDAWGLSGGQVVFDYGAKTVRCGAGLDEAEAKMIVARFQQRSPRLRADSGA